jgi:hypothetical protein
MGNSTSTANSDRIPCSSFFIRTMIDGILKDVNLLRLCPKDLNLKGMLLFHIKRLEIQVSISVTSTLELI